MESALYASLLTTSQEKIAAATELELEWLGQPQEPTQGRTFPPLGFAEVWRAVADTRLAAEQEIGERLARLLAWWLSSVSAAEEIRAQWFARACAERYAAILPESLLVELQELASRLPVDENGQPPVA